MHSRTFTVLALIILLLTTLTSCSMESDSNRYMLSEMSPVEVVVMHNIAVKNDDKELYLSLMSDSVIAAFKSNASEEDNQDASLNYGLISFDIIRVYEAQDEHRLQCIDKLKKYDEYSVIPDEYLAVVFIKYEAEYDGILVPFSSGIGNISYWLIRQSNGWKINAWGAGGMGEADDIYE